MDNKMGHCQCINASSILSPVDAPLGRVTVSAHRLEAGQWTVFECDKFEHNLHNLQNILFSHSSIKIFNCLLTGGHMYGQFCSPTGGMSK